MRPKTKLQEERIFTVELEARADGEGDKPLRIVGHPVVYRKWSEDLGGFREMIEPGAGAKTITEADIRVLLNHDPNYILGRNTADTATFTETAGGIRMEAFPADTATIRDLVIVPMQRHELNQMSFSFRIVNPEPFDPEPGVRYGDHWEPPKKAGDLWERIINEFQMFDASIVTFPAYRQTDAAVRASIGILDGIADLDLRSLTGLLTRAERGLPLTDADIVLLNRTIDALRSYIPVPPESPEDHHDAEPQAGRDVAHLRRLLDLREREFSQAN